LILLSQSFRDEFHPVLVRQADTLLRFHSDWMCAPANRISKKHLKDIEVGTIDFLLGFVPSDGHLSQSLFNTFDDAPY